MWKLSLFLLFGAIQLCFAFPVSAVVVGEQNAFMLGTVTFFIFGIAIVGCVCCGRRKKGFELDYETDQKEFQNESGTLDSNKTEYPIFRALSPDTQRNDLSSNPNVITVNNSNENLIGNDNDNNNGPISSIDLENIENNNAEHYIQNQNEIVNSLNRNLSSQEQQEREELEDDEDEGNNYDDNEVEEAHEGVFSTINHNQNHDHHHFYEEHHHDNSISNNSIQQQKNRNSIIEINSNALNISDHDFIANIHNDDIIIKISNETLNNCNKAENFDIQKHNFCETAAASLITTPKPAIAAVEESAAKITEISIVNEKICCSSNNTNCLWKNKEFLSDINEEGNNTRVLEQNDPQETCINIEQQNNSEILSNKEQCDEVSSLGSDCTNGSTNEEENSIEEALKALDDVIRSELELGGNYEDENYSSVNDDDNMGGIYDEEFDENSTHFQYVIQQLLTTNSIDNDDDNDDADQEKEARRSTDDYGSNYSTNENTETIIENLLPKPENGIYINAIRNVAETLIDSIIKESRRIAEIRQKFDTTSTTITTVETSLIHNGNCLEKTFNVEETSKFNDTIEISPTKENIKNAPLDLHADENCQDLLTKNNDLKLYERSKSLEDFFTEGFTEGIASSTPCVHNKFTYEENNIHPNSRFSKKCLENLFESATLNNGTKGMMITHSPHQIVKDDEFDNNTFIADETKIIVTSPVENKTFDLMNNRTYDLLNATNDDMNDQQHQQQQEDNFIHPGDPCTSKQALERDNNVISNYRHHNHHFRRNYDEDINSDDLTTLTPVNTPIELNYPCETWNKIMQQQQQQQQQQNSNGIINSTNNLEENDLFLYPPPPPPITNDERIINNETFDMNDGENENENDNDDDEDETNLESTFEALKKQLAEILPQPQQQQQGMAGPPEYSDDEQDDSETNNRTFDEYRSPLDGIIGLLESEISSISSTVHNEVFINYKRSLSPIIEESEEETCKTFVMNETKCLDSTSSGCVETCDAIMGVTKTLMASNDTLFNFEDTLGEKEDVFSPRIPSRSDIRVTVKNDISTGENSIATPTESSDTEKEIGGIGTTVRGGEGGTTIVTATKTTSSSQCNNSSEQSEEKEVITARKTPPKTIDFIGANELKQENDLCSPDQQKTFSEGTSSTTTTSTTDRVSSDISPTINDHDTTFTTNTIDEKTCITVIVKDDERISEISEPEWGSTASYGGGGGCEMNSLTDIPSLLDFNVNNLEDEDDDDKDNEKEILKRKDNKEIEHEEKEVNYQKEKLSNSEENILSLLNDNEEKECTNSYHDDSGHSTQASFTDDKSIGNNFSIQPQYSIQQEIQDLIQKTREQCEDFIKSEIIHSSTLTPKTPQKSSTLLLSSQNVEEQFINFDHLTSKNTEEVIAIPDHDVDAADEKFLVNMKDNNIDVPKENTDPNIKDFLIINNDNTKISNLIQQKVQIDDTVIINNHHYQETVIPDKMKYKTTIATATSTTTNLPNTEFMKNEKHLIDTYNDVMMAITGTSNLSGEEDPWIEPLKSRSCETYNGLVENYDDHDHVDDDEDDEEEEEEDDSEEFMYIRGSPSKDVIKILNNGDHIDTNEINNEKDFNNSINNYDGVWSSTNNEDTNLKPKKIKKNSTDDEISEEESSDEFVPSCWNSMAIPARSALKSPDKPSNKNKKNRNVAFKKQRYHSVYEYPKESTSLSSSYSESSLWNKTSENAFYYDITSQKEEFGDGFTVSSSMRPFHGCQFNAMCHTWPIDSDFSWSQIGEEQPLVAYSDADLKSEENDILKNKENGADNKRPDSGVGESAEMLSDRASLHLPLESLSSSSSSSASSDTNNSISNLKQQKQQHDDENSGNSSSLKDNTQLFTTDSIILPTPSCTGSMDSLSSNSSSERQAINFTTFGKFSKKNDNNSSKERLLTANNITTTLRNDDDNDDNVIIIGDNYHHHHRHNHHHNPYEISNKILTNGDSNETNLKIDKIRQSDSTDEDSGIESIVKINK